ncbi:hypothetical protein LRR18_05230 [Mangrovimonas sp. AS39]|uniref:hypothetical protein n=1 Tax=Mangrovimonas futianensis TaxID=2895523 RepID=UPI001E40A1EC|nr:hypothetical protein [Mangrovimonas futianensis]MCF1190979.1 hypothetical protein [Mangrovimonas futianensis]MCF1194675.1 hypothetical protein [Mangrovimonas futianensis]
MNTDHRDILSRKILFFLLLISLIFSCHNLEKKTNISKKTDYLNQVKDILIEKSNYKIYLDSSEVFYDAFPPEFWYYTKNTRGYDSNPTSYGIKIQDSVLKEIDLTYDDYDELMDARRKNWIDTKLLLKDYDSIKRIYVFSHMTDHFFFLHYLSLIEPEKRERKFDLKDPYYYQYLLKNKLLNISNFESFVVILDDNQQVKSIYLDEGGVGECFL